MSEPGILPKPIPFGKYYLLERINVGGMAEVYKAKAFGVEGFERLLAVKKILASIAEDESFIDMFIDEAKIAGQLHHPNIAQIFDLGKEAGSYFIALEYIAGKDLKTSFERARRMGEKVSIPRICYIIMKICEGLAHAHHKKDPQGNDLNIVHRDISPQNILISYEGEVKIIDFGIAKAQGKTGQTQVGILKGKFSYMSPEQVRGLPIDHRSDLFSLGILFYELLTLERLFLGESDFDTLEKIRKVELSPPSLYNPQIPKELEDIVLKALAKTPEERYQSAYELAEAIETFMRNKGYYFTNKDLAIYMKDSYSADIEFENKKQDYYRSLNLQPITSPVHPTARANNNDDAGLSWDDDELETQIFDRSPLQDANATNIASSEIVYHPSSNSTLHDVDSSSEESITVEQDRVTGSLQTNIAQYDDSSQTNPSGRFAEPHQESSAPSRAATTASIRDSQKISRSSSFINDSSAIHKSPQKSLPWVGILFALLIVVGGISALLLLRDGDKARVEFEIDPENVQIYLDDALIHDGTTPFTFRAAAGTSKIVVKSNGYKPFEVTTDLIAGETHKLTQSLTKLDLQPVVLDISTTPDGAQVIFNDVEIQGLTPLSIPDVAPDKAHSLVIKKEGFFDEIRDINLTNDDKNQFDITLRPTHIELSLNSEPSRSDYRLIDTQNGDTVQSGRTPDTLKAVDVTKEFRLIVERRGHKTWEDTIKPASLSSTTIDVALERESTPSISNASATAPKPTPPEPQPAKPQPARPQPSPVPQEPPAEVTGTGTVSIGSTPVARIYLNDVDTGLYTPKMDMEVPAGKRHKITLKNPEFNLDKVYYIELKPGESTRLINR